MKRKILPSLILSLFLLFCGLFVGCNEDRYASLKMSANFTYNQNEVVAQVKKDGLTGVRVQTANSVFDYYSQINHYIFYILNSYSTSTANLQVNFSGVPGDFNFGASFNFDNPIARAQDGSTQSGSSFSKNIVFFESGSTNLTAYSNEGNKKATISIEVIKVASSINFVNNNLALPKTEGSFLDLSPQKVLSLYPLNSSLTSVTYDFGSVVNGDYSTFTSFNTQNATNYQYLWDEGLNFNESTNVLSVNSSLTLSEVVVKATYDNPLKETEISNVTQEDLVCYTTVKFVEVLEDFQIFYGSSYEDIFVKGANNEISTTINEEKVISSIQNLIVNIEDLNSVDVVLRVKSNGEEVLFNFENTLNTPVYFIKTANQEYRDENNASKPYSQATYSYAYYKIVASKRTTDNIRYDQEGIYKLNTYVSYKNYTVDNYPIVYLVNIKNDTLPKNFSINNISIDSNKYLSSAYNAKVYINDISLGTSLYVDVINPVSVSNENSKFTLSLFKGSSEDNNDLSSILADQNKISDVSNYFRVRKNYKATLSDANILTESFYKQTTLYVSPNSTNNLKVGDVYYLVLSSTEPSFANYSQRFSENFLKLKQAIAVVKLSVVKGLDSLTGYEYSTLNYMVDPHTGNYLRLDYTDSSKVIFNNNTFYSLINENNQDVLSNRNYITPLVYNEEEDNYYKLTYTSSNTTYPLFYNVSNNLWYREVVVNGVSQTEFLGVDNSNNYYFYTTNLNVENSEIEITQQNVNITKVVVDEFCYYIENKLTKAYFVDSNSLVAVDNTSSENLIYNSELSSWYKVEDGVNKYYNSLNNEFYTQDSLETEQANVTIVQDIIRLDLSSNFTASITLNYLPLDADIQNLQVSVFNSNIVKVEFEIDESGNEIKNKLILTPVSVGQTEVIVAIPNKNLTYKLTVGVYRPINSFNTSLRTFNFASGVGYYMLDKNTGKNTQLAIVSYGKTIGLDISTLPSSISDYALLYTLYKAQKSYDTTTNSFVYSVSENPTTNAYYSYNTSKILTNFTPLESAKIASCFKNPNQINFVSLQDFNISPSTSSILTHENYFSFNCSTNSFIFPTTSSVGKVYALEITLINLDGTFITNTIFLESYSPVENITSTLDKTKLYTPNTIAYELKQFSSNLVEFNSPLTVKTLDPTVVGVKIEVNKNSNIGASFNFDNFGTLRVIFGSNSETFVLNNGVLTNLANKNILLPISNVKDDDGYFWFKLNDNYNYSLNNGVIFLVFEIEEFSNIFSKTVALYASNSVLTSKVVTNAPEQTYFKLGLSEEKNYRVEITPDNVNNKNINFKTFEVVEVLSKNSLGQEVINKYYVESSVENGPVGCIETTVEELSKNSGIYNLKISPIRAGNSVIVAMPQDKIISKSQFDSWGNKTYISVGSLSANSFITNFYYVFSGSSYSLSNQFVEGEEYFIRATNVDEFLNIWQDYLVLYVFVADGIKVPYQISNINELKEISESEESVTKRYVLVSNLVWDSLENWQAIGNYYQVEVTEDNYEQGRYYYKNSSGDFILNEYPYSTTHLPYYEYGFNGEFSGKFVLSDIKNGDIVNYYSIINMINVGGINCENSFAQGFFNILGSQGIVKDVSFSYNFYQPNIKNFFVFGGVAGVNYGKIENAKINFSNFVFELDAGGIIGGVAGINLGSIINSSYENSGLTGNMKLSIKTEVSNDIISTKIVGKVKNNVKANDFVVGGIIGINENVLIGNFNYQNEIQPLYNDAGFDSSLNISIDKNELNFNLINANSSIGGAVGKNYGFVADVSIQGSINAPNFNNVGGLIGQAEYSEKFNLSNSNFVLDEDGELFISGNSLKYNQNKEIFKTKYSIENCYSIATVVGNEFVGGAIGNIAGKEDEQIRLFFVSAENYAGIFKTNRTFISGKTNVGGFAGIATYADINYSYVISYFDQVNFNEINIDVISNYDIVASNANVAGFIASGSNLSINNSSSFVNCYSASSVGIFVSASVSANLTNVFARGFINKSASTKTINCGYYSYLYWNGTEVSSSEEFYNNSGTIVEFDINSGLPSDWSANDWAKSNSINGGLPYLLIEINSEKLPLYATTPININLVAYNNEENITSYIKYDDISVVLFYNLDFDKKYESLTNAIQSLNTIKLSTIAALSVEPGTYKSYRLDITSNNNKVLSILNNGDLVVNGEGTAEITISSKLNANFKVNFNVVVKYGLNEVELFNDVAYAVNTNNSEISTLKSRSMILYSLESYLREINVGTNNTTKTTVSLKSNEDVGFRFIVRENGHKISNGTEKSLSDILTCCSNSITNPTINNILTINGLNWTYDLDGEYFYIDVASGTNPILIPGFAIEDFFLNISYVPYVIYSGTRVILLNNFSGSFYYNIKNGATQIKTENNVNNVLKLNQLQTLSFTTTMYTDYEADNIIRTVYEVEYENYNDNNIFDVIENSTKKEISPSSLLTIIENSTNFNKESKSVTYTINYLDKINAIEKDKIYLFKFNALSNPQVEYSLVVILLSQDKINQVYGTVYTDIKDFPHTPEKSNYIYNGVVGALSLEVYPYISNYSKIRVSYYSTSKEPLFITQLSYDISYNMLTGNLNTGAISAEEDFLLLEKASGQDTYLQNNNGIYSYSRTYFLSLLVSSTVPDNTIYVINVDFLDRQNNIVGVYTFEIKTIAKPTIELSFDNSLLGSNNQYYLPINTKNELDVQIKNYDGEVSWQVICPEWDGDDRVINAFIPYKENDKYYVNIMKYNGLQEDNSTFNQNLLGKTITIKGSFVDNRIVYENSINIIVTLFTITSINAQGVNKGFMTLPLSSTTPLLTEIKAYYDESLINNPDNWYSYLYNQWQYNTSDKGTIYNTLLACGYEIEENFTNYFIQLQNAITKVDYNYKDLENPNYIKKSGVWFYNDLLGESGYLELLNNSSKRDYNNSTFGFELYNEYPSVYGYQIDTNSNLILRVKLSYINSKNKLNEGETVNGIPNVLNYDISSNNTTYKYVFEFEDDFILNFTPNTDLINAIPISTEEEFLTMEAGKDYRLVSDLVLSNYTPISTEIASLDGNNYTIYITSFSYNNISSNNSNDECILGLFNTLSQNSMLYNVKVYYTNKLSYNNYSNNKKIVTPNVNGELYADLRNYNRCVFGGLVGTNNGAITNCEVSGNVNIVLNYDVNNGVIGSGINGGLVATNSEIGYITNSHVKNFNLSCYGEAGGFVYENQGKIVSSYFTNSSIENLSSSTTGGFVNVNNGKIYECFVEGFRLNTDNDIRNKGEGIVSRGSIGGFVYNNSGTINDSYANISLSSSTSIAGFVFQDSSNSEISRCYTICYKSQTDNSTVAYIFAGATNYTNVIVNGTLNNCYYLSGTGNWSESFSWNSNEENKKATGLDFGKFTTQSFANFDLSLSYETSKYQTGDEFKFVDGYTWVTIEGKPVLASTLVDTISQREYKGKSKIYSEPISYFNSETTYSFEQTIGRGSTEIKRTYFYNNSDNKYTGTVTEFNEEDLVCMATQEGNSLVYKYYIKQTGDVSFEELTINYRYNETEEQWDIVNAYTNEKILDFKIQLINGDFEEDENFRANDMILINYNSATGLISNIKYFILENVYYYYDDEVINGSDKVGTRTNPQIIYDFNSFNYYLSSSISENNSTTQKYFRIIKDINFQYAFSRTAFSNFQGVLYGNYMELNNISISFLNSSAQSNNLTEATTPSNSFGLFAKISTYNDGLDGNLKSTMVSNLTLNIIEVLSNSHYYVGALAGEVSTSNNMSVIFSNINVQGNNGSRAFIQGKNAVGGLVGYASGKVIIKDITCSVNINATKEMDANISEKDYLFIENLSNRERISYAGGVIGVFDADTIKDDVSRKNFNANDVTVSGNISVIGGIVGSAFGLVGSSTVVNYVNTTVENGANNFLKSISFAGGLVGENRGKILSSSITYQNLENYTTVKVGTSELINHDYFYNTSNFNTALAIGGLVGINNGGIVSNCITTINVRNKYALTAGGAVGLMVAGTLENVVASGSVIAELNIGGLVGMVMDENNFKSLFSEQAYKKTIDPSVDKESATSPKTIISNCVASNNWLVRDYNYYKNLISTNNVVAGFIGLIVYSTYSISDVVIDNYLNIVSFNGASFYNNTLYSSTAGNTPSVYLKSAYFSHSENVGDVNEAVIFNIENVWPYSTREFYYENSAQNINYVVRTSTKDLTVLELDASRDPTSNFYYTITSYLNIDNINDVYTKINLSNKNVWASVYDSENNFITPTDGWYKYLINRFGKIYTYNILTNTYTEVSKPSEGEDLTILNPSDTGYYFIGKIVENEDTATIEAPNLTNIQTTKIYEVGNNCEIKLYTTNNYRSGGSNIYDTIEKILEVKHIWLNGVMFKNLTFTQDESELSFTAQINPEKETALYTFINGVEVVKITLVFQNKTEYELNEVIVTYNYKINSNKYIFTTATNKASRLEQEIKLNILSKSVVFNSFDNGYWNFGNNFYLNNNYSQTDKYPSNIENSSIYVWTNESIRATSFADTILDDEDGLKIESAEELALLAYNVKDGNSYEGKTITLTKNIDLSGKYWEPIGTEESPFMGTFNGQGYTIRYAVVNENTYASTTEDGFVPNYAGIFGVVENATISNINVIGGNIYGNFAGGLIGYAKGSVTLSNITNINNVLVNNYGGGIVGKAENLILNGNIQNNGNVTYNTDYNIFVENEVCIGGIVGSVNYLKVGSSYSVIELTQQKFENGLYYIKSGFNYTVATSYQEEETYYTKSTIANNGNINSNNNKTNYFSTPKVIFKIYAGGIAGLVTEVILENEENILNNGNITVVTNSHLLNVGGIFGEVDEQTAVIGKIVNETVLGGLNNSGNIEISYRNSLIYKLDSLSEISEANIGGIIGKSNISQLNFAGNDGNIDVTVTSTTISNIGIGGIVGSLCYYDNSDNEENQIVNECYNSGDVYVLTISDKTSVAVGGIVGFANITDLRSYSEKEKICDKSVTNCYNVGSLTADGNSKLFLGGILGTCYDKNPSDFILNINNLLNNIKYVNVKNCLNIGQVTSTNYINVKNSVGAIVGLSELKYGSNNVQYAVLNSNYYLAGCAYSGKTMFTGSGMYYTKNGIDYYYYPVEDSSECSTGMLSTTLKQEIGSTYEVYNGWSTDIWAQQYDTWYPTLKNNSSTFMWEEKQEKTNQERGYYLVTRPEELAYLVNKINNGLIDSKNVYIQLKNSIDLAGRYWTPIGSEEIPFMGTFNGNGYSIKNLTIDGNVTYGGLFGVIADATISNFGVENPIIQNVNYAGGIVYKAINSRIEKVYTDVANDKEAVISANIGVGGLAYTLIDCKPLDKNNNLAGLYRSYNNVPVYNQGNSDYFSNVSISQEEYNNNSDKKYYIKNVHGEFVQATSDFSSSTVYYVKTLKTAGLVEYLNNSRLENCYNNTNGIVSGRFIELHFSDVSTNILIAGVTDYTSSIINVFNLSFVKGVSEEFTKTSISIINSNGVFPAESKSPTFENLSQIDGLNLNEVWTSEYSLNNGVEYPCLRGLGKEWKNVESENLKTFVYGLTSGIDVGSVEKNIIDYTINNNYKTLVKVIDPHLSYISNSHSHTIYLITSAEELVWVSNNVNNGSLKTENCEFILLNDIDLSGKFWTPIGNSSIYAFQGVFNFNGHVISNIVIDAQDLSYGGLFGYTINAYIANGYIRNAFIKINNQDEKTNVYVGTVVGKGYNTSIVNMSVETRLSVTANSGTFVGGIIGCLTGTRDYIISNVSVNASPTGVDKINKNIDLGSFKNYVVEQSVIDYKGDQLKVTEKNVNVGAFSYGGNVYCGGVVGYMSGYSLADGENKYLLERASNETNIAAVTLSNSSNVYLGGILGYGLEEVTLNVVKYNGNLKTYVSNEYDILGGIVGYMYNGDIQNAYFNGYLEYCQNISKIISYVGGIVGNLENYGKLSTCVNNGEVYTKINYYSDASIGGIIGRSYNHLFNEDKICIYKLSSSGFETSVGNCEFSLGIQAEFNALINSNDEAKLEEYKQKTIYETSNPEDEAFVCFYGKENDVEIINTIKSKEDNFSSTIWPDGEFIVDHIYLIGCQTSFGGLSDEATLITSLNFILKYSNATHTTGNKIRITLLDNEGNYILIEQEIIEVSEESFNLFDQINQYCENNDIKILEEDRLIICYVNLIKAE